MSSSYMKHWHIDATVHIDRVEEIHYINDTERNVRRQPQTRVWEIDRLLGRGGFGEVRLERSREDGKARAVKRIATTATTLNISEFGKELEALLEFSKPKYREAAVFVDFYGWFQDTSSVYLAMEYIQLGDLESNVATHSGTVPETEARDIAEQILSGLEIMHAESFAHRDLKPQNVLVVHGPPEWWVKLADFGLSKRLTDNTAYLTRSGTQSYMAPEVLNYLDDDTIGDDSTNSEYTNAVDIWAVGCIVYRLVTGFVPFPQGRSLMKYCEDRSMFPYDALFDCDIKSKGSKFIRQLLITNPRERPSVYEALRHEWITTNSTLASPRAEAFQPRVETPGLSQPIVSEMDYNTITHDGLKSVQDLSSSLSSSTGANSSTQISSPNTNMITTSQTPTITRKPFPPIAFDEEIRQLQIETDIGTPKLHDHNRVEAQRHHIPQSIETRSDVYEDDQWKQAPLASSDANRFREVPVPIKEYARLMKNLSNTNAPNSSNQASQKPLIRQPVPQQTNQKPLVKQPVPQFKAAPGQLVVEVLGAGGMKNTIRYSHSVSSCRFKLYNKEIFRTTEKIGQGNLEWNEFFSMGRPLNSSALVCYFYARDYRYGDMFGYASFQILPLKEEAEIISLIIPLRRPPEDINLAVELRFRVYIQPGLQPSAPKRLFPAEKAPSEPGLILVKVLGAPDLSEHIRSDISVSSCRFTLDNKEIFRTAVKRGQVSLIWNESFTANVSSRNMAFKCSFYAQDYTPCLKTGETAQKRVALFGEATIEIPSATTSWRSYSVMIPLREPLAEPTLYVDLNLEMLFQSGLRPPKIMPLPTLETPSTNKSMSRIRNFLKR